jgi:hypothetical protein
MLKSVSKYYYTQLDHASQRVYNDIFTAWKTYSPTPTFTWKQAPQVDIQKVVNYIAHDNPGLFYVDFHRIVFSLIGSKATIQSNFLFEKQKIISLEQQIEAIVSEVLAKYNFRAMDDYQKELTLHDYLINSVSYASVTNSETTSVIGALLSKKAVCEGYAKAYKLLCDQAGLACIVVSGSAVPQQRNFEENHAWNIVSINGVHSHVDVTWDSTTKEDGENCYDHFNLTDEDIAKDHTWDRTLLSACTTKELGYYSRNNLCVNDLFEFKHFIVSRLAQQVNTIVVKINKQGITQEKIMESAQEAVAEFFQHGYTISLRHNSKRGTVFMTVNECTKV